MNPRNFWRRPAGYLVGGIQAVSRSLAVVATLIIFVMIVVTVVDVVLRAAVNRPIPGVFEYTEVALATIVFLGLPYTMQVGGHVAIDSLTSRLPSAWRRYVEAAALAAVLPIVIWLALASIGVAVDSFTSGEVKFGTVQAPIWPARMVIPIGAGLLAAEIVIAIGKVLAGPRSTQQADGRPTEISGEK